MAACSNGLHKTVNELLRRNCDVTISDSNGYTALMYACEKSELIAIEILKHSEACEYYRSMINHVNNKKYTALSYACKNGFSDVAMRLINTGSMTYRVRNRETAFFWACKNRMNEVAYKMTCMVANYNCMIDANGTDIRDKKFNYRSIVSTDYYDNDSKDYEIFDENGTVVATLEKINNNVSHIILDQKIKDLKRSETALIWACRHRMTGIATKILAHHCVPECIDPDNNTALIYACKNELHDVANILLDFGCVPEHVNNNGDTALICACENNMKLTAIKILCRNRCAVEQVNNTGDTALINACKNNMSRVAMKILDYECNPHQRNNDGKTAMYYADINVMNTVILKLTNGKILTDATVNASDNMSVTYPPAIEIINKQVNRPCSACIIC